MAPKVRIGIQTGDLLFSQTGPALLVGQVHVVEPPGDLGEENPGQLLVQEQTARIERNSPVAKQFDTVIDPLPSLLARVGGHGDIPGHVPRLEGPYPGKIRLELTDHLR